mmetsp:Transcript_94068/g.249777  ORF Transcript_94068/g.249777 Transcript_94068/m.249777 type:complete len:314 (+) Transcript_94068:80-1021(+)
MTIGWVSSSSSLSSASRSLNSRRLYWGLGPALATALLVGLLFPLYMMKPGSSGSSACGINISMGSMWRWPLRKTTRPGKLSFASSACMAMNLRAPPLAVPKRCSSFRSKCKGQCCCASWKSGLLGMNESRMKLRILAAPHGTMSEQGSTSMQATPLEDGLVSPCMSSFRTVRSGRWISAGAESNAEACVFLATRRLDSSSESSPKHPEDPFGATACSPSSARAWTRRLLAGSSSAPRVGLFNLISDTASPQCGVCIRLSRSLGRFGQGSQRPSKASTPRLPLPANSSAESGHARFAQGSGSQGPWQPSGASAA